MHHSEARRVLFVCAGNTCRSPMAAAMARALLGPAVHVESAGVSADDGSSATRDAVRAMQERGLDISGHRSRSVRTFDLGDFDLLVALNPTIAQDVRRAGGEPSKMASLDIPDPYGKGLEVCNHRHRHRARSQEAVRHPSWAVDAGMKIDLATYLADAISRVEAGGVTSPSGSWLAGMFGKGANLFEREVSQFVAGLLSALRLKYPDDLSTVVKGSPPYEKLTLGEFPQ